MTPSHHHSEPGLSRSALLFAASLTAVTFLAEITGGFYGRSLALLSDAGHVFLDLTALLFALFALSMAGRPTSERRTFGLHRIEVLAVAIAFGERKRAGAECGDFSRWQDVDGIGFQSHAVRHGFNRHAGATRKDLRHQAL